MTDTIEDSTAAGWHEFLRQQGAVWAKDELHHFTGVAAARHTLLSPLEHQRLLRVSGPDAEKFLQGQLTCDLRHLAENRLLLGGHCDPKGRMHSSFTIAGLGDGGVGLRLHASLADSAATTLKKYIVFSKAQLDLATNWRIFALFGAGAEEAALHLPLDVPEPGQFTAGPHLVLLRHSQIHLEIWTGADQAQEIWTTLTPHATPAAPAQWDLAQIEKGVGQVRAQTAGEFIPQMLNFEQLGGISFDKGCYTGQEVVARMHYLGKSKKHMYRALVETREPPAPGTSLFRAGSETAVGLVVQAAPSDQGGCALLAVCSDQAQAEEAVALGSADGPVLQWQPLPYSVT